MNNTDKLLRAFIEAQGFDIEEVTTRTEKEYQEYMSRHIESGVPSYGLTRQEWFVIDYKVTKKKDIALELLIEIINSDDDISNECFLGVDLFDRIKACAND